MEAATESLRHRGPDDGDVWQGRLAAYEAGLGHRRLSIHRSLPARPAADGDGRWHVAPVFNGEIYNFQELRDELENFGHAFRFPFGHGGDSRRLPPVGRRGDSNGCGVCSRFALLDHGRGRVLLARDRLGIKPLYLCAQPGELLFASELKGILAMLDERPALNRRALRSYLTYLYVPAPLSIFEGIEQLEPGERAIFENGELRRERYWKLPPWARGGRRPMWFARSGRRWRRPSGCI